MPLSKIKHYELYNKTNCHRITMKINVMKDEFCDSNLFIIKFSLYAMYPYLNFIINPLIMTVMSLNIVYCRSFPYEE